MVADVTARVNHSDNRARIEQLLSVRKSITSFFREKSDELQSIRECRSVPIDGILEFSRYTTFTLRAPESWAPGMPLIGGHPPAPQPDQMRDGVLQRYNQQRPVIIIPPPLMPTKVMKDIVKVERASKPIVPQEIDLLKTKRSLDVAAVEVATTVVKEEIKAEDLRPNLSTQTSTVPAVAVAVKNVVDQQPHKRARQINISFGLSDSESSDEED